MPDDVIWSGKRGVGRTCGHYGMEGFPDGSLKMCAGCPDWVECSKITSPVYALRISFVISGTREDESAIDEISNSITKFAKKKSKGSISVEFDDSESSYHESR